MIEVILFCLFFSAVWAAIGGAIASRWGHTGYGCLLGALFGPLGALMALFLDDRIRCAACAQKISREACVCPFCRTPITHPDTD